MQLDILKNIPKPCKAGIHCETCRNIHKGGAFRTSLRKSFPNTMSDNEICSFGVPWNFKGKMDWTMNYRSGRPQTLVEYGQKNVDSRILPGNLVSMILKQMGYKSTGNCGCNSFRNKMNDWGWLGCLKHKQEIVEWFSKKAKESNVELDSNTLWGLIKAGIKELRKQRKDLREKATS